MFKSYLPLLAAIGYAASSAAHAQTLTDWTGQLGGLDGVTIACANANTEDYAAGICASIREKAKAKFAKAGISIADLGDYFVKNADRPAKPADLNTPLDITVYVRATDTDNVFAINVRNQISVAYDKAVEEGASSPARRGDLLMWEGSTTGSGPRDPLSAAIAAAAFQKLEEQIDEILKAWPK